MVRTGMKLLKPSGLIIVLCMLLALALANVDCGTRAQVMGGDGGFIYRLLILDGDYKGKTLLAQGDWFEEAK